MSTLQQLLESYSVALSDMERKEFNSLTDEEKISKLPKEARQILVNELLDTVSKIDELKNASPKLPDIPLPQVLSSDLIFSLNTTPLILSASLIKANENVFKNSLIHFCSYVGSFIELNADNPHVTLKDINIAQAQLEAYTKLIFLAILYFKGEEWNTKFHLLKDNISVDFYFIDDNKNDSFEKKYKDQNCSLWIDDWLKIVRLESNKIFSNKKEDKKQIENRDFVSEYIDRISNFLRNIFKALAEHPIASVIAIIIVLFLLHERAERIKEHEIQQLKEQHWEETDKLRYRY
jgi:hypothetical protein